MSLTEKYSELLDRYDRVIEGIREAERESGTTGVILAVAAKYANADELDALYEKRGLGVIGENRTDTLLEHYAQMKHAHDVEIHFIGHLQRNKVKSIIDKVSLIHSLESLGLAEELERQAVRRDMRVRVLVEINIGREESKSGVLPEDALGFCSALSAFPHIDLCGFMTMAPKCENLTEYYRYFKETHDLALYIWERVDHVEDSPILSMGMSESYRAAIAAGATCVRLGSSVFGRTTADMMKIKKENNI